MNDWRKDVLKRIDAPITPGNLRFLSTWQRSEGGHTKNDAKYNWLNTTKDAPGAVGEINSIGVKKFDSYQNGVQAQALTLQNGYYDDIVAGLRSGRPYKSDMSRGLQTWVAGPNGSNPGYVKTIMGAAWDPKGASTPRARAEPTRKAGSLPGPAHGLSFDPMDSIRIAFADDPETMSLFESLPGFQPIEIPQIPQAPPQGPQGPGQKPQGPGAKPGSAPLMKPNGKVLQTQTSWNGWGTHAGDQTDGLGWGATGPIDIMAAPGTAVLAPESGTVTRHGSAQGGQSLYFKSDSGYEYWLGHIAGMIPVGTKVTRGQRIAYISPDHKAPHLHIDKRKL